jgi:hypothetical protein
VFSQLWILAIYGFLHEITLSFSSIHSILLLNFTLIIRSIPYPWVSISYPLNPNFSIFRLHRLIHLDFNEFNNFFCRSSDGYTIYGRVKIPSKFPPFIIIRFIHLNLISPIFFFFISLYPNQCLMFNLNFNSNLE